MNFFLAQAASPTATASATPTPAPVDGLAFTNLLLLYIGVAIGVYLVLIIVGRIAKRRFHVPLGWVYQLFCFSMALFVPSLLPSIKFAGEENIDAAAVLTATFVAISFLRHYIFGIGRVQAGEDAKVPKFLSQLVSIVLVLVAITIVARYIYGADIPGLLAGAGIVGIVLGLALQDTLGNIFSGFAIYFGGQFKKGDWLKVGEKDAEIMEINWRSSRLRTNDNVYLDIPNSVITKETVVNFTHPTTLHALRLEVGVDYDTPPTKVQEVLKEAALSAPYVLSDPAPKVYLFNFADSAVTYQIKFWTHDHSKYSDMLSAIRVNIWYGLRRNNISIPFPHQVQVNYEPRVDPIDKKALIREALAKVFFFECLDQSQREQLVEHAQLMHFGKGEHLIRQGRDDSSMYVVLEGHAEVLVEAGGTTRSVAQIGDGDCIGEMSLLTGEKRSATIIALDDMRVVEIDKETLASLIEAQPALLETLSDLLARRRMQNEGVLSQAMGADQLAEKRKDYRSAFLGKLKSFFQI